MRVYLKQVIIPNDHWLGYYLPLLIFDWLVVDEGPLLDDIELPEDDLPSLRDDGAGGVDNAPLSELDVAHLLGCGELDEILAHLRGCSIYYKVYWGYSNIN